LNKSGSLQRSIVLYFVISTIITFVLLGSYGVYDYHKELRNSLDNALKFVAEDLLHHDALKGDEHLRSDYLKAYQKASFTALFDELRVEVVSLVPEEDSRYRVIKILPDGRYLIVSSSQETLNKKMFGFVVKMALVFGVAFLFFLTVFIFFLNRLLSPLHCLVDFCKAFSSSSESMPLCGGSSEVYALQEAIIGLLQTNQSLCKQKQDIFKEAAHEIKSPLAILKARLALFKQNDAIGKSTFIEESEADIKTISNKLRELLFLKEIEWDMQKEKESISMQEQCQLMQRAFQPILEKKGLKMDSNWEEDFTLLVHKEAMQKVMQAIFENIFMHTKNNSTITNYVDSKACRLHIINEMGDKSDETLFSSYIGSKMIARLSEKMDYSYKVEVKEGKFYTTIVFNRSNPLNK